VRASNRGFTVQVQKVLLVDDEPDIRRLAQLALRTVGALDVLLASSGREALELVSAERPDLIVLDVMMPGMDGQTVLNRLRSDPLTAGIPVILLTAKAQLHEVDEYLKGGAAGVIRKPFDPMTLADEIRRIAGPL
jgi:two-component system, OmpR family, response regulator